MPDFTLYGHPNTASTSIHWLLTELAPQGVSFEYAKVNLPGGEQRGEAYKQVNPKGRVPTLYIHSRDMALSETGAIGLYLAERYPAAHLAPPPTSNDGGPSADRIRFLERYTLILNSHLPALRDWMYSARDCDPTASDGVRAMTLQRLKNIFTLLDGYLAQSAYLASEDAPTVVDFVFVATVSWDGFVDQFARKYPHVSAYVARMRAREAWSKVWDQEGIAGDLAVKDWEKPYLDM